MTLQEIFTLDISKFNEVTTIFNQLSALNTQSPYIALIIIIEILYNFIFLLTAFLIRPRIGGKRVRFISTSNFKILFIVGFTARLILYLFVFFFPVFLNLIN